MLATAPLGASAQNNTGGTANASGTMSSDSGDTGAMQKKLSPAMGNKTANPNDPNTGNIGNAGGSGKGGANSGGGTGGTGGGAGGAGGGTGGVGGGK
ncbi:hypothetical protein [Pararobbsia alpina]|nr:hypothetical protein [Pararobbsia alpina]